jgi:ABC-2 type transport system ATP-binding protein
MNNAANTVAIAATGITYLYPGTRALDNVSFHITCGSVTALVGPNGAGKTTLLRCLAGLDRPLTGGITVAGIDVMEEPRLAHASMGYLSDFFGLYDALTVRQSLAHAASANGVTDSALDETVARTAERLGLADRLDQRCAALSRGLRQRVAIGQAIVHAPAVLLLDEPASGLDPEARHSLATLFTRLRDEGMTLMVSSHILAELDEYSTHMLVLRAGKVVEHRPLGDTRASGNEHALRVTLAAPHANWHATLAAISNVRVIEAGEHDALLAIQGDAHERARVLREMISAGAPVARFAEETENLHQSYLRTMQPVAKP